MEKLIKIQAIINQIEEISLPVKYRTVFHYKDSNTMEIETYCKQWAIKINLMFRNVNDVIIYRRANNKLEFFQTRDY